MKRIAYTLLFIIGIAVLLPSCTGALVYDQYEHTPIAGWEKNDTLSFEVPPLASGGTYQGSLGLRITGAYPFMKLTLIVTSKVYPKNGPKGKYEVSEDTLQCDLIDQFGKTKGQGISYYQYNMPISVKDLQEGDSLLFAIRHDMKREILPGISDIGLKLTRIR